MRVRGRGIRAVFSAPGSGETVRAFAIFALLSLSLAAIAYQLTARELSLQVLAQRIDVGRAEAEAIAKAVSALGWERNALDFSLLRRKRATLEKLIHERIGEHPSLRYVEIVDRFGAPFLLVTRGMPQALPLPGWSGGAASWPGGQIQVVSVQLEPGGRPEGEVRVGISPEEINRQLAALRRSLRIKVAVAASVAVALLVVGFFYILYLIRKNRHLEEARLAAERRSYVGLLASGLAHEIRNPLNAMNMNLQMLEEELADIPGEGTEDYADLLESTKNEIKRLERLVNNVLQYARPSRPHFEATDLNDLLRSVTRFLQADFERRGVRTVLDLEPLLPTVDLDATQFRQALMNLLVNARQALRKGGTVTVRSRAGSTGEVVVEIADDGPGIPADRREKIFEVFFSSRGGGTGLGLPIARQIVERHGGSIELRTEEGKGTTFLIRLPRRQAGTGREQLHAETAS